VRKNIKEAIKTFISFEVERNRGPLILTVLMPYFIIYNIVVVGFPSILLFPLLLFIFPATNVGKPIFIFGLIANLIGLAALVLFWPRKKNKKNIYSVKGKGESILNNKLPVFLPKSMAVIYRNTKAVGDKIVSLRTKIRKSGDYIAILDDHKQDPLAADMANRQKEYYRYFVKHYDSYCSLYLGMRFQFYMELIKTLSKSKKKIHKLNIKQFTDAIREDIRTTLCILKNDALFDKYFANNNTLPYISNSLGFIGYDNNNPIAIKKGWAKDGRGGRIITLKETARQIETINGKIPRVTAHLIALQSDAIIGGVSPVAEENILNKHKQENDFEEIIAYSERLSDEYDRFAAEISLMKDFKK
jgi:hypothetical protein